jgi:hypothetical protein
VGRGGATERVSFSSQVGNEQSVVCDDDPPLILFKEEPMKTMKTVESRVLQILRDCPETRNEDMLLFYRYYNRYADYLRAGELPLEDLAYNYKAYGLPCFESIRRARQRVQSLFPELSRNSANEQDGSVVIVININGG